MNGTGRRWVWFVAAGALVAGACGGDGGSPDEASSTSTSPPDSSADVSSSDVPSPTTVATTDPSRTTTTGVERSTTSAVPSTTGAPAFPYWSAACTERYGSADGVDGAGLLPEQFSTLGDGPSLDLVVPQVITSAGPYGSVVSVAPVPGGFVVGIFPPDAWPVGDEALTSSILLAIDHDGTIRWRRCFDDLATRRFVVGPPELEPTVVWAMSSGWAAPPSVVGIDLSSGADVPFEGELDGLVEGGGDDAGRFVVFGPRPGSTVTPADELVVLDGVDGSTRVVPVPPGWVAGEAGWVQVLDGSASDGPVLADGFPAPGESVEVYVNGEWTDDPAVQREVLPMQLSESFAEPFELRLLDGAGAEVWSAPGFHGVSREGFRSALADDVVLAMRCTDWDAEGSCPPVGDGPPAEEMVAFDLATGDELWTVPGVRAAPVVAGDTAIVTAAAGEFGRSTDGYVAIDVRTGERTGPPGEAWPAGSFVQECCGGDVYVNVRRFGSIVVATDTDHVRVWYPPALTTPTVVVDLTS